MVEKSPAADSEMKGTLTSATERLVGAAALLGGVLYVLVNALYIEFYDDFGVRPEQVGFDRLAVLARSAWVALVAVPTIGAAVSIYNLVIAWSGADLERRKRAVNRNQLLSEEQLTRKLDSIRLHQEYRKIHIRNALSILLAASCVILPFAFWQLEKRVESEASQVAQGRSSNGIGWVIPFVDVRANRASVTWTTKDKNVPAGLQTAKYLTYLGTGNGVTVLLACGINTYIVSASDVAVTLMHQGRERKVAEEKDLADFESNCARP